MDVFFDEFPKLDVDRLAIFVNDCDPDEDEACGVELVSDQAGEDGTRIATYLATLGEFFLAIMVHDCASPSAEDVIDASMLPDAMKSALSRHKAFALLTVAGGKEYAPYEGMILLTKIAAGPVRPRRDRASNPHTGLVFPAGLFADLLSPGRIEEAAAEHRHATRRRITSTSMARRAAADTTTATSMAKRRASTAR
jgi:hypothetical protein